MKTKILLFIFLAFCAGNAFSQVYIRTVPQINLCAISSISASYVVL